MILYNFAFTGGDNSKELGRGSLTEEGKWKERGGEVLLSMSLDYMYVWIVKIEQVHIYVGRLTENGAHILLNFNFYKIVIMLLVDTVWSTMHFWTLKIDQCLWYIYNPLQFIYGHVLYKTVTWKTATIDFNAKVWILKSWGSIDRNC